MNQRILLLITTLFISIHPSFSQERSNPDELKTIEYSKRINGITYSKDQNGYWNEYSDLESLKLSEVNLGSKKYYILEAERFIKRADFLHWTSILTEVELQQLKKSLETKTLKTLSCYFSRPYPPNDRQLGGLIRGTQKLPKQYAAIKVATVKEKKYVRISLGNKSSNSNSLTTYYLEIPYDKFSTLFNLDEKKNVIKRQQTQEKYKSLLLSHNSLSKENMTRVTDSICPKIALDYLPRYEVGSYFYNQGELFKKDFSTFASFVVVNRQKWEQQLRLYANKTDLLDSLLNLSESEIKNVLGLNDPSFYIIVNNIGDSYYSPKKWNEAYIVTSNKVQKLNLTSKIEMIEVDTSYTIDYAHLLTFNHKSTDYVSINEYDAKKYNVDKTIIDDLENKHRRNQQLERDKIEEQKKLKEEAKNDSLTQKSNSILNSLGVKYSAINPRKEKEKCSLIRTNGEITLKMNGKSNTIEVDLLSIEKADDYFKLKVKGEIGFSSINEMRVFQNGELEFLNYGYWQSKMTKIK